LIIPVLERLSKKIFYSIKIIGTKIPIVENLEMLLSIGICKLKLMNYHPQTWDYATEIYYV
jgi:hypothetical protein